ncbi:SCP2 sterol-binding domain-containing protein [Streptomyces hyderabadensis]|uniref:SCP2 domain-containing protein n=1 Tax=Streptomyces hyderabadensis TaxID=598549 RepID=A0ABP9IY39_9ACTN|nr:SCP2 sterol-binding domain-containing protein [Streptomyces hyderabadensis]
MGFASSDEVVTYIGGIFKDAFADPEIGPKLTATGQVFRFVFTDPEATVCVDAPTQSVGDGTGQPPPAATMRMAAEVGNAYWQGKVNLPMAMAKGQITVQGNVASLLKLAPLGKRLFPVYIARLHDTGRADLLL